MTDFTEALDDDLDNNFFNPEEFAEPVTVAPAGGGAPYEINGIFDQEYESVQPDSDADILSVHPAIRVKTDDIPVALAPGSRFTIRTIEYEIITREPDGVGTTIYVLHKVLT